MSELIKKYQKLFGNTGPTGVVGKFGSYRAGSAVYSLDPNIIQALSAYTNGFQYAGLTGNTLSVQDINGLIYLYTRQIKYLHQMGIPEWSSLINYFTYSIVTDGLGNIYYSLKDNNLNYALTYSSNWFMIHGKKVTTIGNNYVVLNTDWIIDWHSADTTTGNDTIILPTPSSSLKGRIYNILCTYIITGPFVSVVSNSVLLHYMDYPNLYKYICDGTTWRVIHA